MRANRTAVLLPGSCGHAQQLKRPISLGSRTDRRLRLRGLPLSSFNQADSFSANASSLLGLSGTLNAGSTTSPRKYLRMVFRDSPRPAGDLRYRKSVSESPATDHAQ